MSFLDAFLLSHWSNKHQSSYLNVKGDYLFHKENIQISLCIYIYIYVYINEKYDKFLCNSNFKTSTWYL